MDKKIAKLISDNIIIIKNPISADLDVMRPSNIPNLLTAVNLNKSKMINNSKIFEVGPIFDETLEDKQINVATAIGYGNVSDQNWNSKNKDFDVFDIKSDLMTILKSLNANKSHGPDGISGKILKKCHFSLAYPLSILFNLSFNLGQIPSEWKLANVVPVHKKGEKSMAENYRPISLTCLVMKIF